MLLEGFNFTRLEDSVQCKQEGFQRYVEYIADSNTAVECGTSDSDTYVHSNAFLWLPQRN